MEDLKKSLYVRGGNVVGALGDKNFSTAPLGTVLSFAGQTAPHGYLLCDGASYKVADYPHLYAVIGNTYGGDTENFNVPNLVDKFIQGSTTSGTEKEAGLPNIEGSFGQIRLANTSAYVDGAFRFDQGAERSVSGIDNSRTQSLDTFTFKASRSNAIYGNSDTVQPPALTMVYIIKAFHTNEGVDSGVSDDVINYVDGEIAEVESKVDGLLDNSSTSENSTWSSSKIASEIEETIDFSTPIFQFEGSVSTTDTYTYTTTRKTMLVCHISGIDSASVTETDKIAYCRIVIGNLVYCSAVIQGDMTSGLGNSCILPKGTSITMTLRSRKNQTAQIFAYAIN